MVAAFGGSGLTGGADTGGACEGVALGPGIAGASVDVLGSLDAGSVGAACAVTGGGGSATSMRAMGAVSTGASVRFSQPTAPMIAAAMASHAMSKPGKGRRVVSRAATTRSRKGG